MKNFQILWRKLENFWLASNANKIKITTGSGLAVFIIIAFIIFLRPPALFPVGKTIEIRSGSTLSKTAQLLKSESYIRSEFLFKSFVYLTGGAKKVIAGDYYFENKEGLIKTAWRITHGRYNLVQLKITIPEGFSNNEIADLLSKKFSYFNKENFLKNAKQGYMFPDTYFFLPNVTTEKVIELLSANFNSKIKSIEDKISSSTRAFDDVMAMASILEKEANSEEQRRMVADILWRRIKLKMPLQVDAAPETYENLGLPDIPISNPGLEAIIDALSPTPNKYLYYLHDKKGNIYYAKTFDEHQRNREQYFKK